MDFLDISILRFIHTVLGNTVFDIVCPILRTKTTWIPLYLFFIYYLWKNYSRAYWKIILVCLIVISLSDVICAQLLKPLFHRIRPCQILEYQAWLRSFSLCSTTFSFPSCHAFNHAALAFFLAPYFPKKSHFLFILWVFIICFSQVYIGVHYPSDILGGCLCGMTLAFLSKKLSSSWIGRD